MIFNLPARLPAYFPHFDHSKRFLTFEKYILGCYIIACAKTSSESQWDAHLVAGRKLSFLFYNINSEDSKLVKAAGLIEI